MARRCARGSGRPRLGVTFRLEGGGGRDGLFSGPGDDVVLGNAGDDRGSRLRLVGGDGDDTIRGGRSKDLLRGTRGSDKLLGERGDDGLDGGGGMDVCKGGKGFDRAQECERQGGIDGVLDIKG